ncbi:MAG TPA: flagellar export chaperone FliS [Bacillota bacterium]|nr:flagellar export chaperone FliS [Bacillota bacterium]
MAVNKGYSAYQSNSIVNSSPEELTLMLYNGLIRFIMQGQKAIDDKEPEKAHASIVRAEDILLEFQATLDMKYELSQGLKMLYDYMYRQLVEANTKKDKLLLEEVLVLAKNLQNTWEQAMKLAKEQAGQASQASQASR